MQLNSDSRNEIYSDYYRNGMDESMSNHHGPYLRIVTNT